jgi:hypothetical protein
VQRPTYVLYQLDEALRYIRGDRLEQVRLALLLLDNAAELQLQQRVTSELQSEEIRERIRSMAMSRPPERRGEVADLINWQPLTPAQKRQLEHSFADKLRFLSQRHEVLDRRLAEVVRYLHRYRNEAYHRARVRPETIRTATVILFEANCLLLLSVFRVTVWSSAADYTWLAERFAPARAKTLLWDEDLAAIVDELRAGVLPTVASVAETLVEHLESRFAELWDALDFVVDNSPLASRDDAVRFAQLDPSVDGRYIEELLSSFRPKWSEQTVTQLESRIPEIEAAPTRLDAFAIFSDLETDLESVERPVLDVASSIDQGIQLEVDRLMGK